jgi:hypothetical protein
LKPLESELAKKRWRPNENIADYLRTRRRLLMESPAAERSLVAAVVDRVDGRRSGYEILAALRGIALFVEPRTTPPTAEAVSGILRRAALSGVITEPE